MKSRMVRVADSFYDMLVDINQRNFNNKNNNVKISDLLPKHKIIIEKLVCDDKFQKEVYKILKK